MADDGVRGSAVWILYCNRYLCWFYPKQAERFFEMLRFSPLVSPRRDGGVVQSGPDTRMSASRSRGHKEARYSLQVG